MCFTWGLYQYMKGCWNNSSKLNLAYLPLPHSPSLPSVGYGDDETIQWEGREQRLPPEMHPAHHTVVHDHRYPPPSYRISAHLLSECSLHNIMCLIESPSECLQQSLVKGERGIRIENDCWHFQRNRDDSTLRCAWNNRKLIDEKQQMSLQFHSSITLFTAWPIRLRWQGWQNSNTYSTTEFPLLPYPSHTDLWQLLRWVRDFLPLRVEERDIA